MAAALFISAAIGLVSAVSLADEPTLESSRSAADSRQARGGTPKKCNRKNPCPVDHRPVANPDSATTTEGSSVTIEVLANDTGLEDGGLRVSIVGAPAKGTAVVEPNLSIRYTPSADTWGTDLFSYSVTDADGDSATAAVSLQVDAVNSPPTAVPDIAYGLYNETVTIFPLGNDSPGDQGDSLRIVGVDIDAQEVGTATISTDGQSITYQASEVAGNPATFSYTAADDLGLTASAMIKVALDIPSDGTGSISGRITDPQGRPVYGVEVRSYISSYRLGLSDADGRYRVGGLGAGDHAIHFRPPQGVNLAPEYHSDAPTQNEARIIPVAEGAAVDGIDEILQQGGTISGVVTDENGNPATGVTVYACCQSSWHANVGADGSYSLVGLAAGEHTIQFVPNGQNLLKECYNDNASCTAPQPVTVTLGSDVTGIDAVLATAGSISGRVTNAAGQPLAGVTVDVWPTTCCGTGWATATTNSDGIYRAVGLPTGTYRVQFVPAEGSGYSRASYPTDVPVTAGQETPGIDQVLQIGGSISGRVTDSAGNPLPGIWVDASSASDGLMARTDSDGRYRLTDLSAGRYAVRFSPRDPIGDAPPSSNHLEEYFDDVRDPAQATEVPVDPGVETPNIDAALADAAAISGRVTDTAGQPVFNALVTLDGYWAGYVELDGTYRISNLEPGSHVVGFVPPQHVNLLPQWYQGADDEASATPMTLPAGETTGIDAILKPGGVLSGRVTEVDGSPIRNVNVQVFAGSDPRPIRYLYTDSDGHYQAVGLRTGEYRVYFLSFAHYAEWYDNGNSSTATRIPVTAGSTTSEIDATLVQLDAPLARTDPYATSEDTSLFVPSPGVLGNDYSPTTAMASLVDNPSHGTVFLSSDGSFNYTPTADFFGTDRFSYTATNSGGSSEETDVWIEVSGAPDAPVAVDDSVTIDEDAESDIDVLANDYDVDGDALTVRIVGGPAMGAAAVNPDGTIHYWPSPDLYEGDSLHYEISDGTLTSQGTLRITQRPVDDLPLASDDSSSTSEDSDVTHNLLSNDTGFGDTVMGGSLTVEIVTPPSRGLGTLTTDGSPSGTSFTYTPAADFFGTDSLTYRVTDPDGDSSTAVWTIEVSPLPDPPTAVDDAATTDEDTAVTIDVLANDFDVDRTLPSLVGVSPASLGNTSVTADGKVAYVPNPQVSGTDTFTYTITDDSGATSSATVTVRISPVDDPAFASSDGPYQTDSTQSITIDVLTNDTLNDGFGSLEIATPPSSGSVRINEDRTITYTPDLFTEGRVTFTYLVRDSDGDESVATVTVDVVSPLSLGGP